MAEPLPVGSWQVLGHQVEFLPGNRGKVKRNDRRIRVDGDQLSYPGLLRAFAEERWTAEFRLRLREVFYRNEDAIFPTPRWEGRARLERAFRIFDREGIRAAIVYVEDSALKGREARLRSATSRGLARPNASCPSCGGKRYARMRPEWATCLTCELKHPAL